MLFDLTFPCYLETFSGKECLSGKVICAFFCPAHRSSPVIKEMGGDGYQGFCGDCCPPLVGLDQDNHQQHQQSHTKQGEAKHEGPSTSVCRRHEKGHAGGNFGRRSLALLLR
jgi:hypothetical protein